MQISAHHCSDCYIGTLVASHLSRSRYTFLSFSSTILTLHPIQQLHKNTSLSDQRMPFRRISLSLCHCSLSPWFRLIEHCISSSLWSPHQEVRNCSQCHLQITATPYCVRFYQSRVRPSGAFIHNTNRLVWMMKSFENLLLRVRFYH